MCVAVMVDRAEVVATVEHALGGSAWGLAGFNFRLEGD